jgi:hypothetical protein
MAAIILKNMIKNGVKETEIFKNAVMIKIQESYQQEMFSSSKLTDEFYLIVSTLIVKEFNANADDTLFFEKIIQLYV